MATGGSSGQRAVIVWQGQRFFEAVMLPVVARGRWREIAQGRGQAAPPRATVTASSPLHASALVSWIIGRGRGEAQVFPPSLPLGEIVAGLNRMQPAWLSAYPSMLGLLVEEARAGRLRINLEYIGTGGEPLLLAEPNPGPWAGRRIGAVEGRSRFTRRFAESKSSSGSPARLIALHLPRTRFRRSRWTACSTGGSARS